jgi:hypothetical protein
MALSPPLYTYAADIEPEDLRKAWDAFQEGVLGAADGALEVTAGSGLTVDVAAGVAFVQGDDETDQGLYRVFNDAAVNSAGFSAPIPTADATDPRVDRIVLRVYDDYVDASGNYSAVLAVLPGTPTAGANLTNLDGAATVPNTTLHLADVLVGAGATTLTSAEISDVRSEAAASSGGGGGGGEELAYYGNGGGGSLDGMELTPGVGDLYSTSVDVAAGEIVMVYVVFRFSCSASDQAYALIVDGGGVGYSNTFEVPYILASTGSTDYKVVTPKWRFDTPGTYPIELRLGSAVVGDNGNVLVHHVSLQALKIPTSV